MIQRKTQTAEYWHNFSLTPADVEFFNNLLLDTERPLTTHELALALVTERCRREETALRAELASGVLYQPKKRFAVGEKVIFPAFDYRTGTVTQTRPGQNPEYGEFDVITVDFGPDRRQRSFAMGLEAPHKLNVGTPELLVAGDLASPERLLATHAKTMPDALAAALAREPGFAVFEDRWLLTDLLADVHVGHLNIAEALVDMSGTAVDSETLLKELGLPKEIKPEILTFSLHSIMVADGRFDQVGSGSQYRWYLRRLEPAEALIVPQPLRCVPAAYDPEALPADLAQLAWDLDDEWSDELSGEPVAARAAASTATVLLTYPHLISGTLPINRRTRAFFAQGHGERTMVTLIDGRWGNRFSAWVNHAGRYLAGLRPWFEKHKLPAGAYIVLERRDNSGEIVVDFRPKRMRREWTRWAQIGEEGRLDIQLRKQEISCEYDEQMIIGDDRSEEILKLRDRYARLPLRDLVFEVFSDLAGLSGAVHPKTVYSALNVVRRCPPAPIFAALAADPRLERAADSSFRLVA